MLPNGAQTLGGLSAFGASGEMAAD
jgi:hypothetical protein